MELLSEYSVGSIYLKFAVVSYIFCYVIEEVLGKYSKADDKKRCDLDEEFIKSEETR